MRAGARSECGRIGDGRLERTRVDYDGREIARVGRGMTHLAEEPGYDVAKDDRLVRLVVVGGSGDACEVPEVALPLIKTGVLAAGVEEEDVGGALNEPAAVEDLYACLAHIVKGGGKMGVLGLLGLDLHGRSLVGERADEGVTVAILLDGDGDFGLDDSVDTADLVRDLPGALEEEGVAYVALYFRHGGRGLVGGQWSSSGSKVMV